MSNTYTNQQLIERYSNHLSRSNKSAHTIRSFTTTVSKLSTMCELINCSVINIEDYIDSQIHTVIPSTINQRIACLKGFFKYLQKSNIRQDNPMDSIQALKEETIDKEYKIIDTEIYKDILDNPTIDLAMRIAISLSAFTGMRTSEICDLQVNNINLNDNEIFIKSGKNNKSAWIACPQFLMDIIKQYITTRNITEGYLIRNKQSNQMTDDNLRDRFKTIKKRYNLDDSVKIHSGRHHCCSRAINSGKVAPTVVMRQLRHSNINTTMRYTHVSKDELRQAINVF
jgi:site-specific recombinase XerD